MEHTIGALKTFNILAARYRGQMAIDAEHLGRVAQIIAAIIAIRCRASPLRVHRAFDEPPSDVDDDGDDDTVGEDNSHRRLLPGLARYYWHDIPLPFGPMGCDADFTSTTAHGTRGHGPRPDNQHVDHHVRRAHLAVGETCLVLWWGRYWLARIESINRRRGDERVTVVYDELNCRQSGVETRLILKSPSDENDMH